MVLYNGGKEYLDELYINQLSLFNKIVQIEDWTGENITSQSCESLKTELSNNFENYNKAKNEKDQADANIIAIDKQKIAAQEQKNIAINHINKTAVKYNDVLIKLHQQMCG